MPKHDMAMTALSQRRWLSPAFQGHPSKAPKSPCPQGGSFGGRQPEKSQTAQGRGAGGQETCSGPWGAAVRCAVELGFLQ